MLGRTFLSLLLSHQSKRIPILVGSLVTIYFMSSMYHKNVLNVDNEDYPNNELTTEGMANSIGMFMVRVQVFLSRVVCAAFMGYLQYFHMSARFYYK